MTPIDEPGEQQRGGDDESASMTTSVRKATMTARKWAGIRQNATRGPGAAKRATLPSQVRLHHSARATCSWPKSTVRHRQRFPFGHRAAAGPAPAVPPHRYPRARPPTKVCRRRGTARPSGRPAPLGEHRRTPTTWAPPKGRRHRPGGLWSSGGEGIVQAGRHTRSDRGEQFVDGGTPQASGDVDDDDVGARTIPPQELPMPPGSPRPQASASRTRRPYALK